MTGTAFTTSKVEVKHYIRSPQVKFVFIFDFTKNENVTISFVRLLSLPVLTCCLLIVQTLIP